MAKWLGLGLVVVIVVFVWYFVRTNVRYTPLWNQPKFGEVVRRDIRVPVTAAGLIEPQQRIEIKSKASGEVVAIPVVEGDYVQAGDTLVVLKKDDEQRAVDRAQAELDRTAALLAQARVAVGKAKENINAAEARVRELEAQVRRAEFDLNKVRANYERKRASQQELVYAQASHQVLLAQLQAARSAARNARAGVREAEANVKLQEAALRSARKVLEDAQERLKETTIISRHNGIVTGVPVKVQSLIQSGTQSLVGGTVVMQLADVSQLKVVARVDEADYGRVLDISPIDALPEMPGLRQAARRDRQALEKRSGAVKLTVDAFPEQEFSGRIERVEPQGKLNQGAAIIQYDVHVQVTDPQRYKLPLGAQAQVEFTVESVRDALAVPAEAVSVFEEQRGVWVVSAPEPESRQRYGRRFVRCRFGITDGAYTQVLEVLGGDRLELGQRVYTKLPVTPERERD